MAGWEQYADTERMMQEDSKMSEQAIFAAMSAVQAALSKTGVGKHGVNQQQRFRFRAWDDVQQALAPALAAHKMLIVPHVEEREENVLTSKSGGSIYHVILKGHIAFVSGEDGSSYTYPAMGEAMDSGDKATSKAITMMVKYAVTHGLCIPLEGVADGDADTAPETAPATVTEEQQSTIADLLADSGKTEAALCNWLKVESLEAIPAKDYARVVKMLEKAATKAQEAA